MPRNTTRRKRQILAYYTKKICILKQLTSGFAEDGKKVSALLTAESYNGRLTFHFALIGFSPLSEGRYRAVATDEHGCVEIFDLADEKGATIKKESNFSMENGFGCLICFVGGRVTPVAFGKCGDKIYDVRKMCALLDEKEKNQTTASSVSEPQPAYDDEIVASENYYAFSDADMETLTIREQPNDRNNQNENAGTAGANAGKQAQKEKCDDPGKDENAQSLFRLADERERRAEESACYYESVKKELDVLFKKYPKEEDLCRCIPLSDWIKIEFSKDKYYTVGIIYDDKKPRYICYGVPTAQRGEPPEALKGKCSFLPASIFDTDGKGYWMMYQDAETGACVKINEV